MRSSRVHVAGTLSGTIKSGEVAQGMLPDRDIHIVDSRSASMGEGVLAQLGGRLAAMGVSAAEIARVLEARRADIAPLRRPRHARVPQARRPDQRHPGRDRDAPVGQADHQDRRWPRRDGRPRPDPGKARERVIELLTASRPMERLPRSSTRRTPELTSSGTRGPGARRLDASKVRRRPRRAVGRAAPGPGLRRRGGRPQALTLADRQGAVRLRDGDYRPMGLRSSAAILGITKAASVPSAILGRRRARPVGSSGDGPSIAGRVHRPAHLRIHRSMTTEHVATRINAWEVAQRQFDLAAERLNLDAGHAPRPARAPPRAHRPLPGPDGRRLRPGLHRLPRPAQPRPRPGQGRHPLPPGRLASTRSRPSRCG